MPYLDKIKFYYNARASLSEANDHWIELLRKRQKANEEEYESYKKLAQNCSIKLQNFIKVHYDAKNRKQ